MENREFHVLPDEFAAPGPEQASLPEEFKQTSGPIGSKNKNRKRKIWLFTMAAAILTVFMPHSESSSSEYYDYPDSYIEETTDIPQESESNIILNQPEINIIFATIEYTSGPVSFGVYSYTIENNDIPWPITVSANITDINGKSAFAEDDEWTESRPGKEYEIETTGLNVSDELFLTITAQYKDGDQSKAISESVQIDKEYREEEFLHPQANIVSADYSDGNINYSFFIDPGEVDSDITTEVYAMDLFGNTTETNTMPYFISMRTFEDQLDASMLDMSEEVDLSLTIIYYMNGHEIREQVWEKVNIANNLNYPLSDGKIILTVYNDTFDMDNADDPVFPYVNILLHQEISESEWVDITLPEIQDDEEKWEPVGFVLHYNGEFDIGYNSSSEADPFVIPLDDTLKQEDIEKIPPNDDNIRYVNVHVLWKKLVNEGTLPLELDNGMGESVIVDAETPFASEGYSYLMVFDTPIREGFEFKGWYGENGEKIEYLSYFDFFPLLPNAQSNEDRDWSNPRTIRVVADWTYAE